MKRIFLFVLMALVWGSGTVAAQTPQMANIRKLYAQAKERINDNGKGGRAPMDMTVTVEDGVYVDEYLIINDVTILQFFFSRKASSTEDGMSEPAQCYFITENWSANGHLRYREQLFDPVTGHLLFSFMRVETHAGFVEESRYYYDADGRLIDQKHKVGNDETTAVGDLGEETAGHTAEKELAARYLQVFEQMLNVRDDVPASGFAKTKMSPNAARMKTIRSRYAEATQKVADNEKSEVQRDLKIVVHDQRSASMPPEVTELQLFYEDVVDSPVADAGTVAEEGVSMKRHCYFMTEHHHNNRMGFDNYREWLFAPKSNSLIFSYSNVKEEGEQMEWRYYFDEHGRCIEAKTEADDVDNGQTDKVVAKRYLKVFNLLSDVE